MSEKKETAVAERVKTPQIKTYDISDSAGTIELANDLANFIKEKKLYSHIQGKPFVNVEGWQYAGARLGIFPIIRSLEKVDTPDNEIRYRCEVDLLNVREGIKVGVGIALCSNKESGKKNYQEYAIASMAQTRAIGKAFRNLLAWIIKAAGYEPTPAEEMDYDNNSNDNDREGGVEVETMAAGKYRVVDKSGKEVELNKPEQPKERMITVDVTDKATGEVTGQKTEAAATDEQITWLKEKGGASRRIKFHPAYKICIERMGNDTLTKKVASQGIDKFIEFLNDDEHSALMKKWDDGKDKLPPSLSHYFEKMLEERGYTKETLQEITLDMGEVKNDQKVPI